MEPTREFIEALDREAIERARRMDPGDRLLAGPRIFAVMLMMMRAGIRTANPSADDATIERLLDERLAQLRAEESPE